MIKINLSSCLQTVYGDVLSTVISVRVPNRLKEKLERYGLNVADIVRKRLLEEVEKMEREELEKELEFLKKRLRGRVDSYELARMIDEERKGR